MFLCGRSRFVRAKAIVKVVKMLHAVPTTVWNAVFPSAVRNASVRIINRYDDSENLAGIREKVYGLYTDGSVSDTLSTYMKGSRAAIDMNPRTVYMITSAILIFRLIPRLSPPALKYSVVAELLYDAVGDGDKRKPRHAFNKADRCRYGVIASEYALIIGISVKYLRNIHHI